MLKTCFRYFEELSVSQNTQVVFLVCFAALAPAMLPVEWTTNEVLYFDLSYWFVHPGEASEHQAIFDSSNGRALSFYLFGSTIGLIGFEASKTFFSLLLWTGFAASLAMLAREFKANASEVFLVLVLYLNAQSLLGQEWIFGTVEAKTFAYIAVLFAVAAALSSRWFLAIGCTVLGVYFHFLVGGFWGAAIILLHALSTGRLRRTILLLALFAIAIAPMILLLLSERMDAPDVSGLDRSLNEIYATFRHPHHVAPFLELSEQFLKNWLPGLILHTALAGVFGLFRGHGPASLKSIYAWMAALNLYIVLAMFAAFLDRQTHVLAPLYVFRPSALIWLLSLFVLITSVPRIVRIKNYARVTVLAAGLSLAVTSISLAPLAVKMLTKPHDVNRLEAMLTAEQRAVVTWMRANVPREATVLQVPRVALEKWAIAPFEIGLERLIERPTIVSFKAIPTIKSEIVTWYLRLQDTDALAQGDCRKLEELSANYVLLRSPEVWDALRPCVRAVYKNEKYVVGAARK